MFLSIFDVKVIFVKIQIIAYLTGYWRVWHYPAITSTVVANSFSSYSSSSKNEQQKIASILSGVDACTIFSNNLRLNIYNTFNTFCSNYLIS